MKDLPYLKNKPIAVFGAGGIGKAMAADCTLSGQDVILCDLEPFAESTLSNLENGFKFHGAQTNKFGFFREGTVNFYKTTTSVKEAMEEAEIIIVAVPAVGHKTFFSQMIPNLRDGQIIHVFPDNYGTLLFRKMMREMKSTKDIVIGGWSSAPYGSRIESEGPFLLPSTRIFYRAVTLRGAALPMTDQGVFLESVKYIGAMDAITNGLGPVGGNTVMDTGFSNVNPILHCPGVILGVGAMENYGLIYGENKKDFSIYCHVYSPTVSKVQHQVYKEECKIADAMEVGIQEFDDEEFYSRSNILGSEYMGKGMNVPYEEVYDMALGTGPFSVNHRYLTEDIPIGCHVFHELGKKYGVKTPTIDSMINLANAMLDRDFYEEGYTLEYLGVGHMDKEELLEYLNNGTYQE
ncbi:MAG TPA: NAD/NADP octopine/nopaline dehydrogenase family protein [Anaerovoracaceae bacterium]|nr:NAD/NADP octopine/nopaline dehydrogenase family protein [Anaerovoracaceae bacterium]